MPIFDISFDLLKQYSNQFTEVVGHLVSKNRDKTFINFYFAHDDDMYTKRPLVERSMHQNKSPSNPNAIYLSVENMSVMNSKSHITISRDQWNEDKLFHATIYFTTIDDKGKHVRNDGGCYYTMNMDTLDIASVPMVKKTHRHNGTLSPQNNVPSGKMHACIENNKSKNLYPQPEYTNLNLYSDNTLYNGNLSVEKAASYLVNACKSFVGNASIWYDKNANANSEERKGVAEEVIPAPVKQSLESPYKERRDIERPNPIRGSDGIILNNNDIDITNNGNKDSKQTKLDGGKRYKLTT